MVCFITTDDLRSWKLSQHEYYKGTGNNGSHLEKDLYSALFIADIRLVFQHGDHKGVCVHLAGCIKIWLSQSLMLPCIEPRQYKGGKVGGCREEETE